MLEEEKVKLEAAIHENKVRMAKVTASERTLKAAFKKAKQMLKSGTLKNKKAIIEKYIKEIVVFRDRIEVEYTISDTYSFKETISKEEINNVS